MDTLASLRAIPKHDWKVRVRVSRCWRRIISNGEITGMGFVVVDQNGSRKMGLIRSGLMNQLENEFVEGRIIDIVNFVVRPYTDSRVNRCFLDDNFIFLTSITNVLPVDEIVPSFPIHVFGCTPINMIADFDVHETCLIDVLGFVHNVQGISRFINKNNVEHSFLNLVLSSTDESSVSVKLWNNLATSFLEEYEGIVEQPMIVLISSCKVNFHRGIPNLTDAPCTRFYINPILPEPTILANGLEKYVVG